MKFSILVFCVAALLLTDGKVHAQTYTKLADTTKLNIEFAELSKEIAGIHLKLSEATSNNSSYRSKATDAEADAQQSAQSSIVKAEQATNGGVKDARKAKRQAKKAYHESKDARSANKKLSENEKRILKLTNQLHKKQERLEQLTAMRVSIYSKIP